MPNFTVMSENSLAWRIKARLPHALIQWWRVLRITYLRFGLSGGMLHAAAIAFFSLVCLGPLGILLATALQLLVGSNPQLYERMGQAIGAIGPNAKETVVPQVLGIVNNPTSHIASFISIAALVWAGLHLFETVERALTGIWPGTVLRSYLRRKLVALAMLVVAGLLLDGYVLFSAFLAAAWGWLQRIPGVDVDVLRSEEPRFLLLYGFAMSFVAFGIVYKFIPVHYVRTRTAIVSGLFAALLWHVGSPVFTYMLHNAHQQGAVLGGLADLVVFAVWSFIGAQILVLGAHFAVAYEHVFISGCSNRDDDELITWPRSRPSNNNGSSNNNIS